ncbi:MAG: Ig-like domain repeat protein, partial [Verrucomicrobiota bacterium]
MARFSYPAGLAIDVAGNTYVADSSNHVIRVITTNGMVTTLAGSGPGSPGTWDGTNLTSARFRCPSAVAVETDRHGWTDIWVADTGNHRIRAIVMPAPSSKEANLVASVVGSGAGFADGDNTVAQFSSPRGLAVQPAVEWGSTVYVADTGNNRIRKIDRYGTVTTLAGTNTAGWADGVGSLAQFNAPQGVAIDGAGNVFVADTGNHRIRKVTPSGVVTTVAGTNVAGWLDGVGAGARFSSPAGLAMDRAGSLVVADFGNNRIRLVTPLGVATTLAGSSASGLGNGPGSGSAFNGPCSVAFDNVGNIRLTDLNNQCVRGLECEMAPPVASTTVWTRVGGSSVLTFSNTITGLLPATTYYYRAVGVNVPREKGQIMSFWTKGSTTTTLVSSTNFAAVGTSVGFTSTVASASSQTAITGNVTFKDGTNVLSAVALVGGTAVLSAGNLVLGTRGITAEYSGDANYDSSASSPVVGVLMCSAPMPTTLDASDISWTNATVSGAVTAGYLPTGAFIQYSTNGGGWEVTTLAGTNPGMSDGIGSVARFNLPRGVTVDRLRNVYVADSANHCIRKISPLGVVTTLAGTNNSGAADGLGRAARFTYPAGVSADYAGNVWVADGNLSSIRKITPGGLVTTFAGMLPGFGTNTDGYLDAFAAEARFSLPSGVVVDNDLNLFVADSGNQRIRGITAAGMVRTMAGTNTTGWVDGTGSLAMFNNPFGVALDKAGNVIVADLTNNCIRKVSQEGVVTTLAGGGGSGWVDGIGTEARFNHPSGVAVDYDGNIYVADRDNFRIRRIDAGGIVTTVAGTNSTGTTDGIGSMAKFNRPTGVAVDGNRTLYVADSGNNSIRKLVKQLGANLISLPAQTGFTGNNGIALSNVITGLIPYTTYYFRLVVTNSSGTNYGDTHSFTAAPPPNPSTLVLNSDRNHTIYGDNVTYTATVSPSIATGFVTFRDGTNYLGTSPLSGGVATFATNYLVVGTHSITAESSGDLFYQRATNSPALGLVVDKCPTTVTVTSSRNPTGLGYVVSLTATVTPPVYSGTLAMKSDGVVIGSTLYLNNGVYSCDIRTLSAGSHKITA